MLKSTVLKEISDFIGIAAAWLIQDINKDVKTVGHKVTPWCVKAGEILKYAIHWVTSLIVWAAATSKLDDKNSILSPCPTPTAAEVVTLTLLGISILHYCSLLMPKTSAILSRKKSTKNDLP